MARNNDVTEQFSVENEFDHLFGENDSTQLIGVRSDGYAEYYEESTDTIHGLPAENFHDVFSARKTERFQESLGDMTLGEYINFIGESEGWADVTEWAEEEMNDE